MTKVKKGICNTYYQKIPKKITEANFKKYGFIIKWQGKENRKENNQFRIIINDPKVIGWRIAYLIVRDKEIDNLEKHPFSYESFEPVKGRAVLYVNNEKTPKKIESFFLDKPVVLKKGIWHAIVTIGKQADVKITENNCVQLHKHKLGYKLGKEIKKFSL